MDYFSTIPKEGKTENTHERVSTCHAGEGKERKDVQQQEGASNKCDTLEVRAQVEDPSNAPENNWQCGVCQLESASTTRDMSTGASWSVSRLLVNVTPRHVIPCGMVSVSSVSEHGRACHARLPEDRIKPGREGARTFGLWARTLANVHHCTGTPRQKGALLG